MLTRSQAPILQFDQEIEKTAKRLRKQTKSKTMAEQGERTMLEYSMPTLDGARGSIIRPAIEANNFEIKPALISMIQSSLQFGGLPNDDPNLHLSKFLQLCDTIKYNGVSDDAIRLRLFPFSLRDKANQWLTSLPPGSITTWNQLTQHFLAKYFPPSKSAKLRNDISTFVQIEMESLYEAWERFQELLRRCPHHGLPIWQQVQIFYNGISASNRSMIDAAAGGTLWRKTLTQAYELIEEMASNSYQWQGDRHVKKQTGAFTVDTNTVILGQLEALSKKVESLMAINKSPPSLTCDLCGKIGHLSNDCQEGNPFSPEFEKANFVGSSNRQQYNPYSNTYNPG